MSLGLKGQSYNFFVRAHAQCCLTPMTYLVPLVLKWSFPAVVFHISMYVPVPPLGIGAAPGFVKQKTMCDGASRLGGCLSLKDCTKALTGANTTCYQLSACRSRGVVMAKCN